MDGQGVEVRIGPRSHQACLNCRRKKVKCDGQQPSCGFCARLLQKCVYRSRRWTMAQGSESISVNTPTNKYSPIPESINTENIASSASGELLCTDPYDAWFMASSRVQSDAQPTRTLSLEPQLPSPQVLLSTLDLFFDHFHSQPYCFFHRPTFQKQLQSNKLPHYLIWAVLSIAVRFSDDPFYTSNDHNAAGYASAAWKEIVKRIFDAEGGLNCRLVQAATLLALYDFTACKHTTAWIKIGVAVNTAQALHMMTEPPDTLPFSAQEESRRTLWSIYLLDKLATCGRHRPSLFLDRTISLKLPCSEVNFETSTPQEMVTLGEFLHLEDFQADYMETLAPTVVAASLLSQVANYAFGLNTGRDQKAPWDHTSEYQTICSQLAQFETSFDCYGDVQETILNRFSYQLEPTVKITESTISTYVIYHLCYCLLQHPFLIRRRLDVIGPKAPASFLARAMASCTTHAQEITRTLSNATQAQYKVSATFLSYCSTVAGSIHCLFQHSPDYLTRIQSVEALQSSMMHLHNRAKIWKTSGRMLAELTRFSSESIRFSGLLDPAFTSVPLDAGDIEQLYALCDYGTISTLHSADATDAAKRETTPDMSAFAPEKSSDLELEDYSSHIDGIVHQLFGLTDSNTMIDNLSFALGDTGDSGDQRRSSTGQSWLF